MKITIIFVSLATLLLAGCVSTQPTRETLRQHHAHSNLHMKILEGDSWSIGRRVAVRERITAYLADDFRTHQFPKGTTLVVSGRKTKLGPVIPIVVNVAVSYPGIKVCKARISSGISMFGWGAKVSTLTAKIADLVQKCPSYRR